MNKLARRDFLVLFGLAFIGLIIGGFIFVTSKSGENVVVKVDSEVVKTLPLSVDVTYEIKTKSGENTVVIKDHKAYISSATCPDKLCMKMGKIDKSGQSIVCLPNRVIIQIEGKESDIDTYTGRLP